MPRLIICADDYGYAPSIDAGIAEAAHEGLLDAVAVMVDRDPDPAALADTGVEPGLHLELEGGGPEAARAGEEERERARREIRRQLDRFRELFGRAPAFLNGHHHAHARPGLGIVVSDIATEAAMAVRSVEPRQRRLLRCRGVRTPDLFVGRPEEEDPPEPGLDELGLRRGVVEWMVHPGVEDPDLESRYRRGRAEDLELLRGFQPPPGWTRTRFAEL